jgi:hypothetical protein
LQPVPTMQLRSRKYLFHPRRSITNMTLLGNFHDQVTRSFLSRRGWVFQERILSKRILHFVQHHIFFEDAGGIVSDDVFSSDRPPLHQPEDTKWNVLDSFQGFVYWYRLVERYTACLLTFEKDRLPAIAGLAQDFCTRNDAGGYMFGLWGRSVHLGLLWVNNSGRPVEEVEAEHDPPSWSWARCRGMVLYPKNLSDSMISSLEVGEQKQRTVLEGVSDEARRLSVEGLVVDLLSVSLTANQGRVGTPFFDPPLKGTYIMKSKDATFGSWVALDGGWSGNVVFPKLSCLRLCHARTADNTFVYTLKDMYYFLLLEQRTPGSTDYRRIGVGVTSLNPWSEKRRVEIL